MNTFATLLNSFATITRTRATELAASNDAGEFLVGTLALGAFLLIDAGMPREEALAKAMACLKQAVA